MRELTDGATAIVRGALDAGCDFFAGYPITPASPILMDMMRELPRVGGVAIQGEDEIASIGMCIGAAMAGARAMTATSGPGMSLYSENVGLAVMGEVPLVIVDVQRLGPATGGATTVGQGDVQFARWGTAGGFPVIVLAPSSIAECYQLTVEAFALARRFRCLVFLLTDKELNLTLGTVEDPPWSRPAAGGGNGNAAPARGGGSNGNAAAAGGDLARGDAAREPAAGDGRPAPFTPYRFDPPEGVPPLALYGGGEVVRFTSSTHDERALITKHPPTVDRLNRHLAAKIEARRGELERVVADLQPGAKTLVVSFGITAGAMREAVSAVRRGGGRVSALTLLGLWPVPEGALAAALAGIERVVVAELNLGQVRREVERLAGGREVVGVHRVDGGLISPEEIAEAVR
jgi:2-oxoglutarate ferredoxin oxidoreductase subunit alpha